MALLMNMDYSLESFLKIHLVFDNKKEKDVKLYPGRLYTVCYNDLGTLKTITGTLDKIVVVHPKIERTYNASEKPRKFILEIDYSDHFVSKLERIDVDNIRDIDDVIKFSQNDITLNLDEQILKHSLITNEYVEYHNSFSKINIETYPNNIDNTTIYHILTESRFIEDKNLDYCPFNLNINIKNNKIYTAQPYDYTVRLYDVETDETIYRKNGTIEDEFVQVPVYGFNIYYRLSTLNNEEWIKLSKSDIPDGVTNLSEFLADTLGLHSMDELIENYDVLYKFDSPESNKIYGIDIEFLGDHPIGFENFLVSYDTVQVTVEY